MSSVPTKQRTREHIIADLSVNHVERQILLAGYVADRVLADYGYDLIVRTFDETGHVENGCFFAQLKASDTLDYNITGVFVSVRLDARDIAMWRGETQPVILIAYDAMRECAYWLHFQGMEGGSGNTARIESTNRFDTNAVRELRALKNLTRKEIRDDDY